MNVVILGHVCIDKNVTEHASYTSAGGPAIFMHKIFSQIPGVNTTIVAPFGKDFLPYAKALPLFSRHPSVPKTLVYENTVKGNIRTQKAYNRSDKVPSIHKKLQELLASCDILFFSPLLPTFSGKYIQELCSYTSSKAVKVLLPQGYYRNFDKNNTVSVRPFIEEESVLPFIDIVILSEQDTKDAFAVSATWSQKYPIISVVTLGEKGAVAFQKGMDVVMATQSVPQSEIIDSVGSGDIFSASFAYAYQKTGSIKRAGTFANAVARQCLFFTPQNIKITPPAV